MLGYAAIMPYIVLRENGNQGNLMQNLDYGLWTYDAAWANACACAMMLYALKMPM